MAERIAFIGFGEAGQAFAAGLRQEGVADLYAYDIRSDLAERAATLGIRFASGHADAVRGADLVLLAVTAASSLDAARACLPGLRRGQFVLDVNSVSPQRKRETAQAVEAAGADYLDVAVMAPVAARRHETPLLIAGRSAREAAGRLRVLGMSLEVVSPRAGDAAAVKMCRSVMIKGLEALMLEAMLGAGEYGVEDRVLASLADTFPAIDWQRLSGYLIERIVSHGHRRAEEMREAAATLRSIGVAPIMADATAARQQWLADLGVKRRFGGRVPEQRAPLLAAIRAGR